MVEEMDYKRNPFTLVYDGAIARNKLGKVNIHPVTYKLNSLDIVANIYTPANSDPRQKYPAIVVAHPNGGVKEQVAGLYAQCPAEQGYIAITVDAAYQGGSGGEPRAPPTLQAGSQPDHCDRSHRPQSSRPTPLAPCTHPPERRDRGRVDRDYHPHGLLDGRTVAWMGQVSEEQYRR